MEVIFTNHDGTVNTDYSYNTTLLKTGAIKSVKPTFFDMLAKNKAKLTIQYVTESDMYFIITDGYRRIDMYCCEHMLKTILDNCSNIAGKIHIENFTDVIFKIRSDHMQYINEFPVVDNTVKFLAIDSYNSIGEECTYFDNLQPTIELLVILSVNNIECYLNNLPLHLKCLYIDCNILKYPIEPFPLDLKCVKLECINYNVMINFPPNLEHLEFNKCNYNDNDVSHELANIPDSVVVLKISYKFTKDVERVPKNCKILGYIGCPKGLYNNLIMKFPEVKIVKYNFIAELLSTKIHSCHLCTCLSIGALEYTKIPSKIPSCPLFLEGVSLH